MHIYDTTGLFTGRAKKTEPVRAKPMSSLLVDPSVMDMFLINSLEGEEPITPSSVFCLGKANEPWQQPSASLLRKYDVTAIDDGGWMVCMPKPDAEVEFFIFRNGLQDGEEYYIRGAFGKTIDGIPNLQRVKNGDAVCRKPHDHSDQWVVARHLWQTYSVIDQIQES